jgi:hypothetical protein
VPIVVNWVDLLAVGLVFVTAACGTTLENEPSSNRAADTGAEVAYDGGGAGGAIDCNWLAGPNCWTSTLAVAGDCLPPYDPVNPIAGTFNASLTQCRYPTGQTVNLPGGLQTVSSPNGLQQNTSGSFSVLSNTGAPCLSLEALPDGFTVTTAAGTLRVTLDPPDAGASDQTMTVVCPDGSSASAELLSIGYCSHLPVEILEGVLSPTPEGGTVMANRVDLDDSMPPKGASSGGSSLVVFDCAN